MLAWVCDFTEKSLGGRGQSWLSLVFPRMESSQDVEGTIGERHRSTWISQGNPSPGIEGRGSGGLGAFDALFLFPDGLGAGQALVLAVLFPRGNGFDPGSVVPGHGQFLERTE